jgi:hypothetical protein
METKKDVLARFVSIIRQLGSVYALPPTSLHVFYDVAGGLIAFNSSGSLFCNLRYYEAWRMCLLYSYFFYLVQHALQTTRM